MAFNATADSQFGPAYHGPSRSFDFTLLFEDTILTILPSTIFVLAAGARAIWLVKTSNKVTHSLSRSTKLVILSAFASIQLSILIARATNDQVSTKASVAAAALDFTSALILFLLSSFEHSRSVTPSTLICLYLLISLPFDAARTRTFFLLRGVTAKGFANLLALSVATKFTVLITEAVEKRAILLEPYRELPPEATSGIYSRSVFWWLNPLLLLGFGKNLKIEDLFVLDNKLTSANCYNRFNRKWKSVEDPGRFSLLWVTASVLKWQIIVAAIPRLLLSATKFAQPFLIQATINFVYDRNQSDSIGWGLAGAMFLTSTAKAVFEPAYVHLLDRVRTQVRGGLVAMIYQKTLDLSIADDPSASLSLMSNDIQRMVEYLWLIHDTWCSAIDVGISLFLLYIKLGTACYAPAIVYFLMVLCGSWVIRIISSYQKRWLEAVETRVSFTSALLHSMRNVKLLGLSSIVQERTQNLRQVEIEQCKRYRLVNNFLVIVRNGGAAWGPFAAFLLYYLRSNGTLDVASAFSVLSILRILDSPLNMLLYACPQLVSTVGCFERIQKYLLLGTRKDNRLSLHDVYDSDTYWGTTNDIPMKRLSVSRSPADEAVVLKNCSFGWTADPVVRDADLSFRAGSITMVVGPVGCGKSTLLKGILSETPHSGGFVYLRSPSIAFADQEAWVQNGTIRDSICGPRNLGVSPYDEEWYRQVVHCCGLTEDLDVLPKGDLTLIGSKGISLSGGQKQRLALARAVYSNAELLILDDVFSGLDNDTEELIFRRLFGREGPLKRLRTTVIMVTHAVHRLPQSDFIISLDETGRIVEQGNYPTLSNSNGYVHSLNVRFKQEKEMIVEEPPSSTKSDSTVDAIEEETENLLRRTGEWASYKHYFKSAGWISSILSFVWSIVWVLAINMAGILVQHFSSTNATNSSNATMFVVVMGISTLIGTFGLIFFCYQIFMRMQPQSASGLHLELLQSVLNASLSFFTKTDLGSITNRFSQDMSLVDSDLPFSYADTLLSFASCLIGIALMTTSGSGFFAATIPVVLAVIYAVQKYYLRTSRQMRLLDLEAKAPLYTMFAETAAGLASIRAFGWSEQFAEKNFELLDRSQRPFYMLFCIQRWLSLVMELVVAGMTSTLMIIIVAKRDSINPGLVGLGLLSSVNLNYAMSGLVSTWTQLETSIGAISRVRDFVRTTTSEHQPQESELVPQQWPSEGEVSFNKFGASYSSDSDLVLKNININTKRGEKVGICGRSGSGKSSMLSSLFHLLEFRDGSIAIDGQDLAYIPRETLRAKLNVIPQEPWWITTETVRFNMDPWDAANPRLDSPAERSERDLSFISALSRCQVWHIIQVKGGLNAIMTADFLSHGQRQLFCLARALIRQSKVVILDEVSANVDVRTDELMQQVIREHFANCTVISVAHRLNTIDDSDRIVVLSQGEVVEVGDPQQLLLTSGSRFKELYET